MHYLRKKVMIFIVGTLMFAGFCACTPSNNKMKQLNSHARDDGRDDILYTVRINKKGGADGITVVEQWDGKPPLGVRYLQIISDGRFYAPEVRIPSCFEKYWDGGPFTIRTSMNKEDRGDDEYYQRFVKGNGYLSYVITTIPVRLSDEEVVYVGEPKMIFSKVFTMRNDEEWLIEAIRNKTDKTVKYRVTKIE